MFKKKKDNGEGKDPFDEFFGDFGSFRGIDEMMNEMMKGLFNSGARIENGKPFVYGFSMKTGPDGKPIVQEFGNVKPGAKPVVSDAREPLVDVVEREKEIIVIAEMPGVNKEDIDLEVVEGGLEIRVDTPNKKYYKVVQLPGAVAEDATDASYNNGVLEVKLKRREGKKPKKKIEVK